MSFLINPYRFGRAWTPADITTALWLDASDASTVTTVSGAVSQWNDKSGNGRNATQSTAASRPTYTTAGQNGLNVTTFDGVNDHLIHTFNASPAPHTVFAVARRTTGGSTDYQTIMSAIQTSSTFGANLSAKVSGSANWGSYVNAWNATSYSILSTWRVLGIVSPTATSGSETYSTDGTTQTITYTARYAGDANDRRAIGGDPSFNDGWLSGAIGEIVVMTSAASTDTRQRLEGYLAHKWGLAGSLPAGHPYKSAAPTI